MENFLENTIDPRKENLINREAVARDLPKFIPSAPLTSTPLDYHKRGSSEVNNKPITSDPFEDFANNANLNGSSGKSEAAPLSVYSNSARYYKGTRPGDNWEEQYAQNQTWYEKGFNGITKGLNLAATTVVGGFGMLYGIGSAIKNGDITKVFDNDVTQGLQTWNEKVDREFLPNFYTEKETNANWYDSDNWMTANFLFDKVIKNSGYAVGAMLSGNIATKAAQSIGTLIGAEAAAVATTAELSTSFKAFAPLLRATARGFAQGKNIEIATELEKGIMNISDLSKRAKALSSINAGAAQYGEFGNKGIRTITALYSSAGEASMEAMMGGNQLKERLISEYSQKNGYEPQGDDLDNIMKRVKGFGIASFVGNMALLGATEYLQLPYLAGSSWKNSRTAARGAIGDVVSTAGVLAEKQIASKAGRVLNNIKTYGAYVFDPKEGGQELGQFALEVGASKYYEKANQTEAAQSWVEGVLKNTSGVISSSLGYGTFGIDEKTGKGVGALNSKEGIEGGLIGALTGGVMQAHGLYQEKNESQKNTAALIKESNNAPTFREVIMDRQNVVNRGILLQEGLRDSAVSGDLLDSKDLKTDSLFNYAMHKIRYGKTDLILDDIQEMKRSSQTDESFSELIDEGIANKNDDRVIFTNRLTEIETFVTDLDKKYEQLNSIYASQTVVDPTTNKTLRRYSDDSIERLAYTSTKLNDYTTRLLDLKNQLGSQNISVDALVAQVATGEKIENLDSQIKTLVDSSSAQTDTDKNDLKIKIEDVVAMTVFQKQLLNEYNDIVAKPENYKNNLPVEEDGSAALPEGKVKETISIKTKAGDRLIEIGVEYALGKVHHFSKTGKEVYSQPRFTVLGKNEDGTIKIKSTKTGTIRDVSVGEFLNYNAILSSEMESNEKYKYMEKMQNMIFENQFIKDKKTGLPVRGRIEYSDVDKKLIFAYKNDKGVVKRTLIENKYFVAQKGYAKPALRVVGELTAAQKVAQQEMEKEAEKPLKPAEITSVTAEKLRIRNAIIKEIYDNSVSKLNVINEKLANTFEKQSEALQKQLEQESITKKGELRKRPTATMLSIINTLAGLEAKVLQEIENLENEKEDIENQLPFLQSFLEDLENQNDNFYKMVKAIKEDIVLIEKLIKDTEKALETHKTLLEKVQKFLQDALDIFNDYIKRIKEENPKIPLGIDLLQTQIEKYLGEEGAKDYIANKEGFTDQVLELESDLNTFQEELEIPKLSSKAKTLENKLKEIAFDIKQLNSEKQAKQTILDTFERLIENEELKKEEARKIESNQEIAKELIKTHDSSTQIISGDRETSGFEANQKKEKTVVVRSGVASLDKKDLNIRADKFANILHTLSDDISQNLRMVLVTKKTEKQLGLGGLSQLIVTNANGKTSKGNASDVITMVLVSLNANGTYTLVNESGSKFTEKELVNPLNFVITQVMPSSALEQIVNKAGDVETMFRDTVSTEDKNLYKEQYGLWRIDILESTELQSPQKFTASFGRIKNVQKFVETRVGTDVITVQEDDFTATTPVSKTELASEKDIENKKVIEISISNSISSGNSKFQTSPGRLFLKVVNGLVKLNNRRLNSKEVDVVYNSLVELSNILKDNGTLENNDKASIITNWLKTIVYWGTPKQGASQNNIWFKTTENEEGNLVSKLFIGKDELNVSFTNSDLDFNKEAIIETISKMYHNVSLENIKEEVINKKYRQVTGYEKDGTPTVVTWKNYQTYLLSNKGRKEIDIPVTTSVVAKEEATNGIVRSNIYYTLDKTIDEATYKPTEAEKIAPVAPVVPKTAAFIPITKASNTSELVLDGITLHRMQTAVGDFYFVIDAAGSADMTREASIYSNISLATVDKFIDMKPELTEETSLGVLIGAAKNLIAGLPKGVAIEKTVEKTIEIVETKKDFTSLPVVEVNNASPVTSFIMDGTTVHNFTTLSGDVYKIIITESGFPESYLENNIQDPISKSFLQKLVTGGVAYDLKDAEGYVIEAITTITTKVVNAKTIEVAEPLTSSVAEPEVTLEIASEVVPEITPEVVESAFSKRKRNQNKENKDFFKIAVDKFTPKSTENFEKVEEWIKKVLPNIPVYRVKNIIQATNGRQAWGMLHKGAVYLYENAGEGTAYHEIFEAVWAMTTSPKERKAVVRDFKNRKGTYVDRFTGEIVTYATATEDQLREELAEEFSEYIIHDKYPEQLTKQPTTILGKIFKEILDTLKAFFLGEDALLNTAELFKRIGDGYYAQHVPYEQKLSLATNGFINIDSVVSDASSTYKLSNISATEVHEIMQSMTYSILVNLVQEGKSVFKIAEYSKEELAGIYSNLKEYILDNNIGGLADRLEEIHKLEPDNEDNNKKYSNIASLYNSVDGQWSEIVKKHKEFIRSYNIQFEQEDEIDFENLEKSKDEGYKEARYIDAFAKLNTGLKLFLSSIPEIETELIDGNLVNKSSSIGGVVLVPLGTVYIDLLSELHTSTSQNDMINKFRNLAITNVNYNKVFYKMFKQTPSNFPEDEKDFDYNALEKHDIQIIKAFVKSFMKEAYDVQALFILPSGDIIKGDSNSAGAAKDNRLRFVSDITQSIQEKKNKYIVQNEDEKFVATDSLNSLQKVGNNVDSIYDFLSNMGINFTRPQLEELKGSNQLLDSRFVDAVNGIITSLKKTILQSEKGLDRANETTLDIAGRLLELGIYKANLERPEFEITYFNINKTRSQTFMGTNWMSNFHNIVTKVKNIKELKGTNFEYLQTDVYSENSILLDKLFDKDTGENINLQKDFLKAGIADGTIDEITGDSTDTAKLDLKQRTIQETNLNINGVYMNLVPGDGSMQSDITLHTKENPFVNEDDIQFKEYQNIFKGYFLSEVALAKENRFVVKNKNSNDLRFFKSILSESTHENVLRLIANKKTAEGIYEELSQSIKEDVDAFFEKETNEAIEAFKSFEIITLEKGKYLVNGISYFENETEYSLDFVKTKMKMLEINFAIANIELHKLLYSDPYQYSGELKRIKSFTSPREIIQPNSAALNKRFQELYTDPEETNLDLIENFERTDIYAGTMADIISVNEVSGGETFEESDGAGVFTDKFARFLRINAGDWYQENEDQYNYDIAFMKDKEGMPMTTLQKEMWKNGNPNTQDNYTPKKPIVAGNTNMGRKYNSIVLDKFALFHLSYRHIYEINKDANMLKLYKNMINSKSGVDYMVHKSARKIGAENVYELYDENGKFNTAPIRSEAEMKDLSKKQTVLTIPMTIFGIQSEVPSKETSETTQGSQPTKLSTMDFWSGGIPIDFEIDNKSATEKFILWTELADKTSYNNGDNLYNEVILNKNLLEARIEDGLQNLLIKFGITETEDGSYSIADPSITIKTLKKALLSREVNDNITEALNEYEKGVLVLEAMPSYQQIRNILYGIAHKMIVAPKLTGKQAVQFSSGGYESGDRTVVKVTNSKGVVENAYQSDILKFYTNEDGKRTCEIMISRWFKSNKSDADLIKYFNSTPEGQKIIKGVAFRIPTQKQNSIEVFVIKSFLPIGMKDSVMVPSALVKKVGSDFDIDKLFVYLKNTYEGSNGDIKQVPYFGIGEMAIQEITKLYKTGEFNKFIKDKKRGESLLQGDSVDNLLESIFQDDYKNQEKEIVNYIYRQGLDNAYVESFERLVSHPLNFDNLVKPNSAQQLQDIETEVSALLDIPKPDYENAGNMLNRRFMTGLRHDLVQGKYNIGIAATSQTNNSQFQKLNVTIEPSKLSQVSKEDKEFLGDCVISFRNHNKVDGKSSLSKLDDANPDTSQQNTISDIIGQVIDGYVDVNKDPWIMRLGLVKQTAGVWLLLTRLGVPFREVAFFMNQPIIRAHLANLQNKGIRSLFSKADGVKEMFGATSDSNLEFIPDLQNLRNMIGKTPDELAVSDPGKQAFIFQEFLKFAKMAEHLLKVTQATNFDTSTLNEPFLIFKKYMQIEAAKKTIFSNVDDILNATFMGVLAKAAKSFRNAFAEILTSDSYTNPNGMSVRDALEKVLFPFIDLNDSDFVSVSKKAVMSLFDWAVQTDTKLNTQIKRVLLADLEGRSIASDFMKLKEEALKDPNHFLHNNYLLKKLEIKKGEKKGEVDNLFITAKDTKTYDQNQIIYSFQEIKKFLTDIKKTPELYKDLVRLSALQSGLQNSKFSFSNLLPFSDFIILYNKTLSNIQNMDNLHEFVNTNIFPRTNTNDKNIVPKIKDSFLKTQSGYISNNTSVKEYFKDAAKEGLIPMIIKVKNNSKDVVRFSYTDPKISRIQIKEMIKRKDYSYKIEGLFQKIYKENENGSRSPLIDYSRSKGKVYEAFLYKQINSLGNSIYAKEYYRPATPNSTTLRSSVLTHSFAKVERKENGRDMFNQILYTSDEVEDAAIIALIPAEDILLENAYDNIASPGEIKTVSESYGVLQVETAPAESRTQEFINLIAPQIKAQAYKENKGVLANQMFHFGKMWARIKQIAKPIKNNSYAPQAKRNEIIDSGKNATDYTYAYHEKDQNGNALPSMEALKPIIEEIQNNLGIDMSNYDSVIGNIYLDNEFIYPHKDTTESKDAEKYPVVVYTIGNNAALGIVDNNEGKMTFANQYDDTYLYGNDKLKGYTNEVLTTNGTIYTFGMEGKGRFQLTHSTPVNNTKKLEYPPITLPNGKVITKYTITLTFRRALDLDTNTPKEPAKLENANNSNNVAKTETPISDNTTESFVKIAIPKRESKKSKVTLPNNNGIVDGYKLILPGFEKAEVYISNELAIDGTSTKTKSWNIIVKVLDKGKFVNFPIQNSSTIVEALKEFADSINNKYSLTEKNRNLLASIGITLKNNLPLQNTEDTSWKEEGNNDTCVPF